MARRKSASTLKKEEEERRLAEGGSSIAKTARGIVEDRQQKSFQKKAKENGINRPVSKNDPIAKYAVDEIERRKKASERLYQKEEKKPSIYETIRNAQVRAQQKAWEDFVKSTPELNEGLMTWKNRTPENRMPTPYEYRKGSQYNTPPHKELLLPTKTREDKQQALKNKADAWENYYRQQYGDELLIPNRTREDKQKALQNKADAWENYYRQLLGEEGLLPGISRDEKVKIRRAERLNKLQNAVDYEGYKDYNQAMGRNGGLGDFRQTIEVRKAGARNGTINAGTDYYLMDPEQRKKLQEDTEGQIERNKQKQEQLSQDWMKAGEWNPRNAFDGVFNYVNDFDINNELTIYNRKSSTTAERQNATTTYGKLRETEEARAKRAQDRTADFYISGAMDAGFDGTEDEYRAWVYDYIMDGQDTYADRIRKLGTPEAIAEFNEKIDQAIDAMRNPYGGRNYNDETSRLQQERQELENLRGGIIAYNQGIESALGLEEYASGLQKSGKYNPALIPEGEYSVPDESFKGKRTVSREEAVQSGNYFFRPQGTEIEQKYWYANHRDTQDLFANQDQAPREEMFMDDDQLETFNKLFEQDKAEGTHRAEAYLEGLHPYLSYMKTQYEDYQLRNLAEKPVIGELIGLSTVPARLAGGLVGDVAMVAGALGNKAAQDPTSDWFKLQRYSRTVRDERADQWDKALQSVGMMEGTGRFLNSTGYSILDNMAAMYVAGAGGTGSGMSENAIKWAARGVQFIMSSEAAADTYLEQLEANRSPSEAILRAAGAGAIEWITEKYSLEALLKPDVKAMLGNKKQIMGFIAKNIAAEGSEEGASDLLNIALDKVLSYAYGHEDELTAQYNQLVEAGVDPDEASKQVLLGKLGEMGLSMLGGGISGGVMAGGRVTMNSIANRRIGGQVKSESNVRKGISGTQRLINLGAGMKEGTQSAVMAREMQERMDAGQKVSDYQVGKLAQMIAMETGEQQAETVQETMRRTIKDQLMAKQVDSRPAETFAGIIAESIMNDGKLTKEQKSALSANEKAMEVWKGYQTMFSEEQKQLNKSIKEAAQPLQSVRQTLSYLTGDQVPGTSALKADVDAAVSEGKDNGEALDLLQEKRSALFSDRYIEKAKSLLESDQDAKNSKSFVDDVARIRLAAYSMAESLPGTGLSDETAQALYDEAKAEFEEEDQKRLKNQIRLEPGKGTAEFDGHQYGTYEFNDSLKLFSKKTQNRIRTAAEFSRRMGQQVRFINDTKQEGIYGFESSDGTITINIAGRDFNGSRHHMLVTMSHEMTHWLEQNSQEGYSQLRKYVLDSLRAKGVNIEQHLINLIDNQNAVLGAESGESLDLTGALREVVAQSCENLLSSQAFRDEIFKTNPTLAGKITRFVRDFVNRANEAIQGMDQSLSMEARMLKSQTEEIAKIWLGGRAEAMGRENTGAEEEGGERISYSTRQNGEKYSYESLTSKEDMKVFKAEELSDADYQTDAAKGRNVFAQDMMSKLRRDNNGSNAILNEDTGKNVFLNKLSFKHSIGRKLRKNYDIICHNIIPMLRTAVAVNEANEREGSNYATYLIGAIETEDSIIAARFNVENRTSTIGDFDILYAIAKNEIKKEGPSLKLRSLPAESPNTASPSFNLSIANLLDIVKDSKDFAAVFSRDVAENMEIERPFIKGLSENLRYSVRTNEQLDAEYAAAVKAGDLDRATEMLMDKLAQTEGIIPFNAPHGYGGKHKDIANLIKNGTPEAVAQAAADMAQYVPENAVLIPMPPHEGTVESDTDTMILADAISQLTGRPVVVALESDPRESRYKAKSEGRKGVSAEEMGFRQVKEIPEGTMPIFIDNVVGSGVTADAARTAMGGGITLSYAKSTRSKGIEGLKRATVTYDKNGKLIPLSQRFDRSVRNVNYSVRTNAQLNDAYMDAVEKGDEQAMRELVDEAARRAGYTVTAYHGTPEGGFTVFNTDKVTNGRVYGNGIYFTSRESEAENYASKTGKNPQVYSVYLNLGKNPLVIDRKAIRNKVGDNPKYIWSEIREQYKAEYNDATAVVIENSKGNKDRTMYIVKDSSQVKSAELITRDKNGKVIPLSERFNQKESDIRYSVRTNAQLAKDYQTALNDGDKEVMQQLVLEYGKRKGYKIRAYHGTGRADRVGTVFRADRATSGPMAFFTDNREIAENYSRDKKDTSIAYDEEYGDYHTQFRYNLNGKDIPVSKLWDKLDWKSRQKIIEAAKHINFDDELEEIIYDPDAKYGPGGFTENELRYHKGNAIDTLIYVWLDSANLWNREGDFLKVLELAGIKNVKWNNPDARDEKVYDTILKINNPFDTGNMYTTEFLENLQAWWDEQDQSVYDKESMASDFWDKNGVTVDEWIEYGRNDIESGTSHNWTRIPDAVSDYLKSQGYDGIKDTGGKNGGTEHTVWIPFESNQIKSAEPVTYDEDGNPISLEDRFSDKEDIRWSVRQAPDMDVATWMEGLTPGQLSTEDEVQLLQAFKSLRMDQKIANKRIRDYQEKLARLEKLETPTPEERADMVALRNKIKSQEEKLDKLDTKLAKVTSSEGFAGMMYENSRLLQENVWGKTPIEIEDTVRGLADEVEETRKAINKEKQALDELAQKEAVKAAQRYLKATKIGESAKELKKRYQSKMTGTEIESRLAEMVLKLVEKRNNPDNDFTVEEFNDMAASLATDLARMQKGYAGGAYDDLLDRIRQVTIRIGKTQAEQLKAEHSSVNQLRQQLKGSGVKVIYDPNMRGAGTLEDVGPGTEIHDLLPEIGDDAGIMGNIDNFVALVQKAMQNVESDMIYNFDMDGATQTIQTMAMAAAHEMAGDKVEAAHVRRLLGIDTDVPGKIGDMAARMGAIEKSLKDLVSRGKKAGTMTAALQADMKSALDYYNKTAQMAAEEARMRVKENVIQQLKSEHGQQMLKLNQEWQEKIKKDKDLRQTIESNNQLRQKITTNYNRIRKLLMEETDKKNVPEEAKPLARLMIKLLNDNDTVEGRRHVLFEDKKGRADTQLRLTKMLATYGPFDPDNDLNWLIIKDANGEADTSIQEKVMQDLVDIETGLLEYRRSEGQGTVSLKDRRNALQKIQEAVTEITSVIRARGNAFIAGKRYEVATLAEQMESEMGLSRFKGERRGRGSKAKNTIEKAIGYGNLTPEYFIKNLRNSVATLLHQGFHDAENRGGLEAARAKARIAEIAEKNGYGSWDGQEKHKVEVSGGGTVIMTTEQIMTLYATWLREKNALRPEETAHLLHGGFVLADNETTEGKARREKIQQRPIRMKEYQLNKLGGYLTDQQRQYVDDIVEYMSNDLAKLGNEASMEAYGVKKFTEQYYFPIKTWGGVLSKKSDAGAMNKNDNRAMRQSFSKRIKANASNAVEILDFTPTAMNHVVGMITFNTVGPAVENMNKVLNYQLEYGDVEYGPDGEIAEDNRYKRNVEAAFQEAYGKNALEYLRTFMSDVNGGTVQDQRRTLRDRALTIFKKNAVAGSLSVALQQPLSYIRASMLINPKYMTAAKNPANWKNSYAEMMKYSGVAVIKEMGRFDMNIGASMKDYITPDAMRTRKQKAYEWISDKSTKLPELADRMTWTWIWSATKAEQAAEHPEMDKDSDEFLEKVAERFNEVVRKTQVYDSVMVKSQNMRSTNIGYKIITSFMAEPTLSLNVLADAVQNVKEKGGKTTLAKAGGTFLLSAVFQAIVKGVMGSGRSPDEKKTLLENFLNKFQYNLINEANPISLIAGYSDVIEVLKTGELKDDAMSVIGKLKTIARLVNKEINGEGRGAWMFVEDTVGQLAQLFYNVPVKNLMRDARAIRNLIIEDVYANRPNSTGVIKYQAEANRFTADNTIGVLNAWLGEAGYKTTNTEYYKRIHAAEAAGNTKAAEELKEYMLLGKGVEEKTLNSGLNSLDYKDLYDALENNKADGIKGAVKRLLDRGVEEKTIRSQLTKEFKPKYLAADSAGRIRIRDAMQKAYKAVGKTAEDADKIIEGWKKDK